MEFIADILLVAGALGAGFYCYVLARRLTRFNDLENGMGGAVAVLSAQVDDLSATLKEAQTISGGSTEALSDLTHRAEIVAQRLELMMASMHDIPAQDAPSPPEAVQAPRPQFPPQTRQRNEPIFMRHSADKSGAA